MSISHKFKIFEEKLGECCAKLGRIHEEITVLAVTKLASPEDILELYSLGHKDFGENYAQKILPKIEALPNDIRWHFIGELQANKINKLVGRIELFHAIDSFETALELQKRMGEGMVQKVLIEANTSCESQKHGAYLDEIDGIVSAICEKCPQINIIGLMTVAPFVQDETEIARCFSALQNKRFQLQNEGFVLPHLSMGMTGDWQIALKFDATILRIGSAFFA